MVYRLLLIGLSVLLSACAQIKLSERQLIQPSEELPFNTYGLIGHVCQAADGGFVTVLMRTVANRPKDDYTYPYLTRSEVVLVKTDASGQSQWTKLVWSGIRWSSRPLIHPLADGNYLVFLMSKSGESATSLDYSLIRVSSVGDVIAQLPTTNAKISTSFQTLGIISIPGNGFYVKGQIQTYDSNANVLPYILRFDEQGRLLWRQEYDQAGVAGGTYGLAATSDGGLILSRYGTNSINATDGILLKINAAGQTVWLKRNATIGADLVAESPDKGYVLAGRTPGSSAALTLFRLDSAGLLQTSKQYASSTNQSILPLGVYARADSYTLIHATATSGIVFLTTDAAGNEQTRQTVGNSSDNLITGAQTRLADGSFVFALRSINTVSLLKTKTDKTVQWRSIIATDT